MANMTFDEACAAAAAQANAQLGEVAEHVKFTTEEVAHYAAHLFYTGRRFAHLRGFFAAMKRGTEALPCVSRQPRLVCIAGPDHLVLVNPIDQMAAERHAMRRHQQERAALARRCSGYRRAAAR